LTLASVFLLLAALGIFVNIPGVSGWTFWKYNTDNAVSSVAVSLGGNYTVAGTENGNLFLLNKQGTLIWSKSLGNEIVGVSISGDDNRILVGVSEYSTGEPDVFLFDKNGDIIWEKDLIDSSRPCDVSISQNGNYIATGDTGYKVRFFNSSGDQLWAKGLGDWATSVSVSSAGDHIAAGSWDNNVYFFNRSGGQLWSYNTTHSVYGVSTSPEGGYVASVGSDIFFFDGGGHQLWNITSYFGEDISVSANGNYVAAGDGGKITLLNKTGGELWNWDVGSNVNSVAITSDGKFVVGGAEDGFVYFIENLQPSSITCEVSDWQIYFGESITVSGTIDPTHIGVGVTLTYTDPADTVLNRTVTTTGDGNYSDTLTPNLDGMWSVLASWLGDADTMGAVSSEVRFLVSTVTDVTVKIGRNQTFFNVFQPSTDYHYSPMFEDIVWDENITSPADINFTTVEGKFTYYETIPGLGGTITSYNITYNIGVLEGTTEGIYEVTAYYDITSQSTFWPYPITFLFRYELRCRINAVVKYETSIDLSLPPQVKLGEEAAVSGTIVPTGGPPVAGVNVTLSYTKPDESVVNRTAVTETDGSFQDAYMPDVPGTWSVKASWTGDEDHNGTESLQVQFSVLTDLMHQVTWDTDVYFIRTLSNSTVSNFFFTGSVIQIGFNVSGLPDTGGFCNVTIPSNLLWGEFAVFLDGSPLTPDVNYTQTHNGTHYLFYINYIHRDGPYEIEIFATQIIPEFPSVAILSLLMVLSLVTVALAKEKTSRKNK